MADNVTLNPGSGGATAASDEIAGVHFQRIKLVHGADGVNDGDVSTANPIPAGIRKFCVGNSSSSLTPLGAGATYTSSEFSIADCGNGILIMAFSDQNGTAYLEEKVSTGGWRVTAQAPYVGNTPFAEMHVSHADTWRVRFVNGATPQTTFEIKISQIPWGIPWITKIDPNFNTVTQGNAPWAFSGQYSSNAVLAPLNEGLFSIPAIANTTAPTFVDGRAVALSCDLAGNLRTTAELTVTPSITRTAQSATNVTLVAAADRAGFVIHNDSVANLYIKLGVTASTTSYTYKLRPDETLEFTNPLHYEGQIDAIWDAAGGGAAQVTEFTHA